MGTEAIGSPRRSPDLLTADAPDSTPDLCRLPVAARVLSALFQAATSPEQVRAKAVGLGLLRHSVQGKPGELTPQALSRLFLAGYSLPATMEQGSLEALLGHIQGGLQVFVALEGKGLNHTGGKADSFQPAVFRVAGLLPEGLAGPSVLLIEPGAAPDDMECHPLSRFEGTWERAGGYWIAAAHSWEAMPKEGGVFFGGSRSAEGVYHWHTAECDTDCEGHILRY